MDNVLFDTVKTVSADEAVRTCMEEYQRYLADTKLPNPVDGLKDVARRAIYVMGVKKDDIKFAQFIASVMETHPHGDLSIKAAIERLFRTWDIRIPLIQCEGNVGSYTEEPGAPRYLEVSSSEFARDLFFNGVHMSTIPMRYTVEYNSFEPKYFIPRLPNALLMGNLTIGLGFKSVIFPLNLNDVCVLVQRYIEHLHRDKISPFTGEECPIHFVPDFATFCYLRNEKELVEGYSQANFDQKVYTDGVLEISKHQIVLRNMPALLPLPRMHEKLIEIIKQKSHWINNLLKDFKDTIDDKHHGSLKFIFKNNVDVWKILPKIKKLINFTSSLSPIYAYETEGKIINLTPPRVLKYWYDARYQSIVNGLNVDQNQLLKENMIIDALLHVVDHKEEVIDIVKNADNDQQTINQLASKFAITLNQATVIADAALRKLNKATKEEMYKRKEDIKQKIKDINSQFSKVPDIIYDDAVYFKKKYGKPRRTLCPVYIGYVHIGKYGLQQYVDEDDLFTILNTFTGTPMTIHQYRYLNKTKIKKVLVDKKLSEYHQFSIPRQLTGQAIFEHIPDGSRIYTVVYVNDTVSYVNGYVIPKDDKISYQYVYKDFIGIDRVGHLKEMSVTDLSSRKNVSTGAKSDLVYAIPFDKDIKNGVVIYMSDSPGYINSIFLTPIHNSKGKLNKLLTTPPHTFTIIDVVPITDTGVICNIPKDNVNIAIDYVYINSIANLLIKPTTTINLRSGSYTCKDGSVHRPTRHADYGSMVII